VSFVQSLPCAVSDGEFWSCWMREKGFFLRMCARWLRCSPHDAEDVLSRGALKALGFLRAHPAEVEKFRPWALRMLHNLCIDSLRARNRECIVFVAHDGGDGEPQAPARTPEPDRALLCDELGAALAAAVGSLPPRLQTTFRMRILDELPYDEISRRLAISQENARKRVQQARELLRERLGDYASWRF
jgi:RNA polymerase sigma-70 factor (ECF subfamily)